MDPILSRGGATRTLAAAETTPAPVTTDAEIVPLPRARRAVNVVAEPALGASVPRVGGVSDHVADTGAALPYASAPATANRCEARARTIAEAGVIVSATAGPGVTVTG